MPGPKNMTKQSGDVHPPELEGAGYEDIAMEARADADADPGAGSFATTSTASPLSLSGELGDFRDFGGSLRGYADAARQQVRAKPYAALGGAFVFGFVIARLFR
jgi:hypothetical protein